MKPNFTAGNVLVCILPILGLAKLNIGGQLFVHEMVLSAMLLPIIYISGRWVSRPQVVFIALMAVAWLLGQVLTDVIRETAPEDYQRGWAKIVFFFIAFLSLAGLLRTERRVLLWVSISVIPMAVRPLQLFADELDLLIWWKFGLGASLLMFCCLPFLWGLLKDGRNKRFYYIIAGLHFSFGFISFFLNARSFAALSILTGLVVVMYEKYRGRRLQGATIGRFSIFLLAVVFLLAQVYSLGASSGAFGEDAREKLEMQNAYDQGVFALLLGGRSEALVSTVAISDSPIIGHGSWAKDFKYVRLLSSLKSDFTEIDPNELERDDVKDLIPTHSYLLGAWVEAGLLGGLFWLYVLWWIFVKVIPVSLVRGDSIGLLCVLAMPGFVWNVLFSPFGANVRVEVAAMLAIFAYSVTAVGWRKR